MKSLFRCPVCGGPLDREERVYRCADRHSYDIAKEGYTYLLPPGFPIQRVLYAALKYAL